MKGDNPVCAKTLNSKMTCVLKYMSINVPEYLHDLLTKFIISLNTNLISHWCIWIFL